MADPASGPEFYQHIRTVIGIGLSLSLARLLTGLARFVQHPSRQPVYAVHLGWVAFMILEVLHFWWFEFALGHVRVWTFERYFFVVSFASVHFVIATVLFPDDLWEYGSFRNYFIARRKWFFGLLIIFLLCDQLDTLLKGEQHYLDQGVFYPIKQFGTCLLALVGAKYAHQTVQKSIVLIVLVSEVLWIGWRHLNY